MMSFEPIPYPWTMATWDESPTPRAHTFLDGEWPIWRDRRGAQVAAYSYACGTTEGRFFRAVPVPSTGVR